MSDQPIKHDQIIEPGVFTPASEGADILLTKLDAMIASFKQLMIITGKKIPITDPKTLSEAEQLATALKKISDLENGLSQAQKAKIQAQIIVNKQNSEYRNQIKAEASEYQRLSIQLENQKKQVKDLLASKKELSDTDKKLIKDTQELDKHLKTVDGTVGDNRRNVGAYREALNDVTAEMGTFGGMISRIARTLKTLQEQQDHTTTGWQKMGTVLKAVGIGIALALIAAVVKANEAANAMSEALQRASDKFDIYNVLTGKGAEISLAYAKSVKGEMNPSLKEALQAYSELVDITIAYNNNMRVLQIDLQKLNISQNEFNQIANDTTIGYNERIAAQKESIALSIQIAAKNIEIAQTELAQSQAEIKTAEKTVGLGNANKELKDKLLESTLKFNEAQAASDSLTKENATKLRQLAFERTDELIDLTLKTKQNAHARKAILEEELKDAKIQIDEKRKINQELFLNNQASIDEELKIFKKGRDVQFDANKLLHEQNEVLLADKIKAIKTNQGHGLDQAGVVELSKIIKQSQENEIANNKEKNLLDDEEIKNLEKIASLKRETALIDSQFHIANSEKEAKIRLENYQETNKKLLEEDNVFNFKMQRLREFQYQLIDAQDEMTLEQQKQFLQDKEKDAEINANNTITDNKVLAAEILKLQTQLNDDLQTLDINARIAQEERDKKKHDDDVALYKKQVDERLKVVEQINDGVKQGLEKRYELQQQADQHDIDMHARMLEVQAKLASEGKANVLGQTEAQTAKAEEKKLQDAKKAAKQQMLMDEFSTFEKTFASALKKYEDDPKGGWLKALGEALAAEGTVSAVFTKMIAGFYEGTEDTGTVANPLDDKGGRISILHDNERVVPKWQNDMLGGISNDELIQRAIAMPAIVESPVSVAEFNGRQVAEMTKQIVNAIKSQPAQRTNLGKLGEWTEQIQEQQRTTIINHKKNNSRPSLRLNG